VVFRKKIKKKLLLATKEKRFFLMRFLYGKFRRNIMKITKSDAFPRFRDEEIGVI
jgi:hypothetical protein